jgi:hypothetical protein
MENQNNGWKIATVALLVLVLVFAGIAAFKESPKIPDCKDTDYNLIKASFAESLAGLKVVETQFIPSNETISLPEFDPYLWRDSAWSYILDNWKDKDFDDSLKYCDNESYKPEKIKWDFSDEMVYSIENLDKNKFCVEFTVTGDYDRECEQTYNVSVCYDRDRDPSVSFD